MEVILAFILAIVVALCIIQISPFRIRVKSPEEKAVDQTISDLQDKFEQELMEAQS